MQKSDYSPKTVKLAITTGHYLLLLPPPPASMTDFLYMQAQLNIAKRAARRAGKIIAQASANVGASPLDPDSLKNLHVQAKAANDWVTDIDKKAENIILDTLREAYPSHGFLGEESGLVEGRNEGKDYLWVVDPLDGTTNFIRGIPHYAVSIALKVKGQLEVAVVYDPIKNEEFTALRGKGARLNDKRIRVSPIKNLNEALLGTGFPFLERQQTYRKNYLAMLDDLTKNTAGIRRAGSASLDLAYVAAGRLDGFWEYGLMEWDIAGGVLLITEAGGLIGTFSGGHDYLKSGNVVCGNAKIFKAILQAIRPHLEGTLKS